MLFGLFVLDMLFRCLPHKTDSNADFYGLMYIRAQS